MGARKFVVAVTLVVTYCLFAFSQSSARSVQEGLSIKVSVGKSARAVPGANTITFFHVHPAKTGPIPAAENDLTVTVKARTSRNGPVTLYVLAEGDLVSDANQISVEKIRWEASGPQSRQGTLSKSTCQVIDSWAGSGEREYIVRFFLDEGENVPTGDYTTTISFSAVAP